MRIEAVSVCVNYGDFLRAVAPHNLPQLDRWVIVTTPEGEETRAVCRQCSLECVTTRDFYRDGETFAKSRGIERGLAHVEGADWILHLDADIALPADFRETLKDAHLANACLYGCDRLNVPGWQAWQRVQARGLWARGDQWCVPLQRPDCTLGRASAIIATATHPSAFFSSGTATVTTGPCAAKRYPLIHGTAARTDVAHALHWDRQQRIHIPELLVWHLESEPTGMGANWKGRKTARFGPPAATKIVGSYVGA